MSFLFLADNAIKDNAPRTVSFENEDGEEVVFSISQSRSASKPEGQDAIASHVNGRWQCVVLCDGHDVHGHLVARAICEELSLVLLDMLTNASLEGEGEREVSLDLDGEQIILAAFEETERRVMWSNAMLQPNSFVRIIDGEHANKVGFVSEVHDMDDSFTVIVIDSDAFHRPRVPRQFLVGARFVGGATCVAFVRDSFANLCRVAVMGDTRCMIINGRADPLDRDPVFERLPESNTYLSFPHDVYNTAELARLQAEWDGEHQIDGCYLVNPLTGCEIQPTRGFGDFDMFGTGFVSQPDVSLAFPLDPDTIVILGSDGLFDSFAWKDDFQYMADFVSFRAAQEGMDVASLGEMLHLESARRSDLSSGYVDDIAFFLCRHIPRETVATGEGKKSTLGASSSSMLAAARQSLLGGVEGLPPPAPAASPAAPPAFVTPLVGRLSASLSEIAVNRRISHALTSQSIFAAEQTDGLASLFPTTPKMMHSAGKRLSTTADFINPNAPRYIKHSLASVSKEDTIRRTRGPSFMLPEGFDCSSQVLLEEHMPSSSGNGGNLSTAGEIAMDLARIGEDVEYMDGNSPADAIRHLIAIKRKSVLPPSSPSSAFLSTAGSAPNSPKNLSANTILQRMAARYGHDASLLQEIAKDLHVV